MPKRTPNPKRTSLLKEVLPGRLRVLIQTRRKGEGAYYVPVAGFTLNVEVRSEGEAERLFDELANAAEKGRWHDDRLPRVVDRGDRRPAPADRAGGPDPAVAEHSS